MSRVVPEVSSALGEEGWAMSQAREPFPLGPEGPERAASVAANSFAVSLPREKRDEDRTAVGERIPELSSNQNIQAEVQDQPVWVNYTDGDLIRTQPQPLPQPNALPLEVCKKETGNIENGHTSLNNGSGFCTGVGVVAPDSRTFSAPVSQKLHRKIQSSLTVNTENSKKSSAYSHKPGSLHRASSWTKHHVEYALQRPAAAAAAQKKREMAATAPVIWTVT